MKLLKLRQRYYVDDLRLKPIDYSYIGNIKDPYGTAERRMDTAILKYLLNEPLRLADIKDDMDFIGTDFESVGSAKNTTFHQVADDLFLKPDSSVDIRDMEFVSYYHSQYIGDMSWDEFISKRYCNRFMMSSYYIQPSVFKKLAGGIGLKVILTLAKYSKPMKASELADKSLIALRTLRDVLKQLVSQGFLRETVCGNALYYGLEYGAEDMIEIYNQVFTTRSLKASDLKVYFTIISHDGITAEGVSKQLDMDAGNISRSIKKLKRLNLLDV